MFDAIELASRTGTIVCRDGERKYHRFRPSRFYGGIATADCVGCCLRCVFCWSWKVTVMPEDFGEFYSPEEVAGRLVSVAKRKGFHQLRISGNEPTLCKRHLIGVLDAVPGDYLFIIETNGILIGWDESYAEELSRFPNVHVRVSLKGTNEEEFSSLTGAKPEGYQLQLRALELLMRSKVRVHAACMTSFSTPDNIKTLRKRLRSIHRSLEDFEVEELILYPHVAERLSKLGVRYLTAYRPENIPPSQI
jgi:uncharacterized Fe-S cluster-containing radical SAM superfamily protein